MRVPLLPAGAPWDRCGHFYGWVYFQVAEPKAKRDAEFPKPHDPERVMPRPKKQRRDGLRIRGSRGHPVVRRALIRFAAWLRLNYEFPVRVPVYLLARPYVNSQTGKCSASFFGPYSREEEPYIRIATGDYKMMRSERDRDDVLASYINSLAHEVVHYQQWIATGDMWERGVAVRAHAILRRYARTTARP